MKILEIRDNGGETIDRYTVAFDQQVGEGYEGEKLYHGLAMNAHPFHPQGFGQHTHTCLGEHLGKLITFEELPIDCRKLVTEELDSGAIY